MTKRERAVMAAWVVLALTAATALLLLALLEHRSANAQAMEGSIVSPRAGWMSGGISWTRPSYMAKVWRDETTGKDSVSINWRAIEDEVNHQTNPTNTALAVLLLAVRDKTYVEVGK